MRAVILLGIALVLLALALAFATARTSGASSRSTFVVGLLAILAGPWGWTLRAQTAALPLFAGVLWLLVDASRRGPRRQTLLVLPLLVIWANLHGSVVLGAGLTVLLGIVELVRARRLAWIPLALVALSPLGRPRVAVRDEAVAYYDLMLVDAPFAPDPARVAVVEARARRRRSSGSSRSSRSRCSRCAAAASRLTFYELAVLAVTFVGAVQAVRGVIWFALAAAAILPVALDGVLTKADVAAPRLNRIISLAALAGLAVAPLAFLARPASWYVSEWPERAGRGRPRRRRATRTSGSGRPTAPPTGSSGGSPTSAAASPTTSGSSSTTTRRSTGSSTTGARKPAGEISSAGTTSWWWTTPSICERSGASRRTRVVYGDKTIFVLSRPA